MDYALMQVADETQEITRLEKYNLNGKKHFVGEA